MDRKITFSCGTWVAPYPELVTASQRAVEALFAGMWDGKDVPIGWEGSGVYDQSPIFRKDANFEGVIADAVKHYESLYPNSKSMKISWGTYSPSSASKSNVGGIGIFLSAWVIKPREGS